MDHENQTAKDVIEHNHHNIMVSKINQTTEGTEPEIRLLRMQIAKHQSDTSTDRRKDREDLEQDLESRRRAWPQFREIAPHAEKRTMDACQIDGEVLRCYIGSVDSLQNVELLTDEQVEHVTEQAVQDKQFVLVVGSRMFVKDAVKDIGPAQRQRAFQNVNNETATPWQCVEPKSDNIDALLANIGFGTMHDGCSEQNGHTMPSRQSQNGYTSPLLHRQSPDREDDGDGMAMGQMEHGRMERTVLMRIMNLHWSIRETSK